MGRKRENKLKKQGGFWIQDLKYSRGYWEFNVKSKLKPYLNRKSNYRFVCVLYTSCCSLEYSVGGTTLRWSLSCLPDRCFSASVWNYLSTSAPFSHAFMFQRAEFSVQSCFFYSNISTWTDHYPFGSCFLLLCYTDGPCYTFPLN